MIFKTKRLHIRPLEPGDLNQFHKMQSDYAVMRYVGNTVQSLEESSNDLKNLIRFYERANNDFWVWAIINASEDCFIGTCALVRNEKGENEIGFRLLKEYWSKGYGKEVVNGLIRHAFEQMKLTEVVAYADKENISSVRILDSTFKFIREFYNHEEDCIDRYYKISN